MPFANDHRGNPVHAGKRTQDTINAITDWQQRATRIAGRNVQDAVIGEDVAFERADDADSSYPTHPLKGSVKQNASGRWQAELYRPHDFDAYGGSWAEGSLAIESDRVNDRLGMVPTSMGDFRTENRAKMAVAAMANRRNEGRNWKTGRGIVEQGPGAGGRPY